MYIYTYYIYTYYIYTYYIYKYLESTLNIYMYIYTDKVPWVPWVPWKYLEHISVCIDARARAREIMEVGHLMNVEQSGGWKMADLMNVEQSGGWNEVGWVKWGGWKMADLMNVEQSGGRKRLWCALLSTAFSFGVRYCLQLFHLVCVIGPAPIAALLDPLQ